MKKFFTVAITVIVVIFALSVLSATVYVAAVTSGVALDESLLPSAVSKAVFYDVNGEEIGCMENGFADSDEIPDNLKKAFVAIEDKRFYTHKGYDAKRIVGAGINNVKSGEFSEGASTITQQLVKNTHLSSEKTVRRKLKEIKLARQIEKQFEKDEIITMYLNVIYFGKGNYGIKAASNNIFGKQPSELSLSECAALAGTVKNPSAYCPLINKDNSMQRRNLVLSQMLDQGYIDESEYSAAKACELVTAVKNSVSAYDPEADYLRAAADEVMKELSITRNQLDNLELKIYTYYDPEKQSAVNISAAESLRVANSNGIIPDLCVLISDNSTGGISAFYCEKYAVEKLRRQSGSVLKPLAVYAPSLDQNIVSPCTPLLDEKTDFGGFSPENYGGVYYGNTCLREAVAHSMNVPAVKTLNYLGADNAAKYLDKLSIVYEPDDLSLALALGATKNGISALEIAGGYACLARGGTKKDLSFVAEIKNHKETLRRNDQAATRVFSEDAAYLMTNMLEYTAKSGTAKSLSALGFPVAAKTGTVGNASGNSDAWCVSYTTKDTLLVWHGNGSGTKDTLMSAAETGGAYTTAAARAVWEHVYKSTTRPVAFEKPDSIVEVVIDSYVLESLGNLQLAGDNTPEKYKLKEVFSAKNLPTTVSTAFSDLRTPISVRYVSGRATITFQARNVIEYELTKIVETGNGKKYAVKLKRIANKNGEVTVEDFVFPRNNYVEYVLTPVLTVNGSTTRGEQTSARIYAEMTVY